MSQRVFISRSAGFILLFLAVAKLFGGWTSPLLGVTVALILLFALRTVPRAGSAALLLAMLMVAGAVSAGNPLGSFLPATTAVFFVSLFWTSLWAALFLAADSVWGEQERRREREDEE